MGKANDPIDYKYGISDERATSEKNPETETMGLGQQ